MNILFGTLLSSVLTLTILYFKANKIENGDLNAVLMYFVVYAIPIIILAIIINLIINLIFEPKEIKRRIFMVIGLAIIFYYFSNLLTAQYDHLLKMIAIPFLISALIVIALNLKKISITKKI